MALILCVLSLASSLLAADNGPLADPPGRAVRVSAVEGEVVWQTPSDPTGRPAVINTVLSAGDAVDTGADARAELHLGTVAVRVAPKSHVVISGLSDAVLVVDVQKGSAAADVNVLPDGQIVTFTVESARLLVETPGHFRVSLDEQMHRAAIFVREGEATLALGPQKVPLQSNQSVRLSRTEAPTVGDASARDAFDAWCDARDARDDASEALKHVSPDTVGYADLDDQGTWINTEDGPAWSPSNTADGWAPYTQGQWQWSDTYGWTWVDDNAWAYAPSHYGRWGYYDNTWAWVPGPVSQPALYAPALVAFLDINLFADGLIATWAYATWFALAPHEPYIPGYYASNAYVQHINYGWNLNTVPGLNRTAPNAVVSVRDKVMQAGTPVAPARQTLSAQARTLAPATGSAAPIWPNELTTRSPVSRGAQGKAPAPPAWAMVRRTALMRALQSNTARPVYRAMGPVAEPRGRDYQAEHLAPPPHVPETRLPPANSARGAAAVGGVGGARISEPRAPHEPTAPGRGAPVERAPGVHEPAVREPVVHEPAAREHVSVPHHR